MAEKGCKGYCFKKIMNLEPKKTCNLPECKNYERVKKLAKQTSEKLLKEVERNLY